jgi:2-methylcitrate dehydratase PrpD
MSPSITTEVVDFILKKDAPPTAIKKKAVDHVIDGIAVMLAGSRTECVKTLGTFIREKGSTPSSTLIGFNHKSHPADAALVNGTSGHADDYDDTQLSSSPDRIYGLLTHPTVPVIAAALAIGETLDCSGRELLEAFIAGFEVECKLAEAIKPEHYTRGFHTTGTIGAFGAAAASSRLLGLEEDEVRYALGMTASMSSGIRVNFGTMTKPLHAGMAASNGVVACTLAKKGYTADREALDGRWGFMNVLGQGADPEKLVGKLGKPYTLLDPGASIKMYPCGSLGQPSMDTLLEIVVEENLTPEDVQEIRLRAGPNILEPLRYTSPVNGLQAKFSLQFGLASILAKRRAGLREYTTEVVNSQDVRKVMAKVKTLLDPEVARMGTEKMRSIVEVELHGGRVIRRVADTARGTPEKPLTKGELDAKFQECASFVLENDKLEEALEMIRLLEDLPSIQQLTSLLTH